MTDLEFHDMVNMLISIATDYEMKLELHSDFEIGDHIAELDFKYREHSGGIEVDLRSMSRGMVMVSIHMELFNQLGNLIHNCYDEFDIEIILEFWEENNWEMLHFLIKNIIHGLRVA